MCCGKGGGFGGFGGEQAGMKSSSGGAGLVDLLGGESAATNGRGRHYRAGTPLTGEDATTGRGRR